MGKSNSASRSVSKSAPARGKSGSARKNNTQTWLILAGLAVLILIAAAALIQRGAPAAASLPDEVTVQQAQEMVQNGAFLLDVRTQEEWNDAHVDGATLIPLDQLAQRANELPKDQQVAVICRSGNRSAQGRDILRNAGFTQVTSVAGGMNDWRAAGFPTVSGP